MSRSRYKIYDERFPHFLTCTVVNWIPIFSNPQNASIVLDSLTFLQEQDRLELYGFVLMENHLHLIASSENLIKEIGDFKSFTARKIIDHYIETNNTFILGQLQHFKEHHKHDRKYQLWQEGSHPQQITSNEMMIQKLEYIHLNPVKRRYVDKPEDWRYSSARNYQKLESVINVTTEWM
jgi:REP-associated tyrosine transposase